MKIFMGLLAVVLLGLSACAAPTIQQPAVSNQYPQQAAPSSAQPSNPTGEPVIPPSGSVNTPGQNYSYGPGGMMGGYYGGYGTGSIGENYSGYGGYGPGGIMGGYYGGGYGPGGMMGYGYGGMMGSGAIGPGGPYRAQGQRLTMDQAITIAQNYLKDRNDPDLALAEVMEYDYNFYVEFYEKSTGIYAFEALIDPYTGDMYPEPGPNMMWNSKYGMMSGVVWGAQASSAQMTVSEDQALADAQKFIDGYLPGATVQEPHRFYGYYTMHVYQGGNIYGMLSVNGYTGQVWYHSWHGRYVGMKEFRSE